MIEAAFRVTTPMFCGGADGARAELRGPSFKGVLRFWWRACAWSRFPDDMGRIKREEERLFGGPGAGQSRVRIRLYGVPAPQATKGGSVLEYGQGTRYLGFGLKEFDGSSSRACLPAPFDVVAGLQCRGLTDPQRESVIEAVRALGMLGGMGARSRRGWGSLSLVSLKVDGIPEHLGSRDDLYRQLRDLGRTGPDQLPGYTALSPRSRVLVGRHGAADAMAVLDELGKEYQAFRRSGRRDGKPSMLADDGKIVLDGYPPGAYPKRVAFGLPVNYGENKPVVEPVGYDRRASPLFFHVHDCDGQAVPVVSFLPARFLPRPQIAFRGGKKSPGGARDTRDLPEDPDTFYRPVVTFLDDLSRRDGIFAPVGEGKR